MSEEFMPYDQCLFASERTAVYPCALIHRHHQTQLTKSVMGILTKPVLKTLPSNWQQLETEKKALSWLQNRFAEGELLAIQLRQSDVIIGFLFTHKNQGDENTVSINIGYLLAETHWGQGYASEVLTALVEYYKTQAGEKILFAGVAPDNHASIRVLKKCGFKLSHVKDELFYELKLASLRP